MNLISGLVLRISIDSPNHTEALAGPLVYASIGYALAGVQAMALGAISSDVSDAELNDLEAVGVSTAQLSRQDIPSLKLVTRGVLSETDAPALSGDASRWAPTIDASFFDGNTLSVANADPKWLSRLTYAVRPTFLAMDLHRRWIAAYPNDVQECTQRCDLVSGTAREWEMLERSSAGRPEWENCIRVIKQGAKGIRVELGQDRCDLPPPEVEQVKCDIGAGDLLFGFLSAFMVSRPPHDRGRLSDLADGYMSIRHIIGQLLAAESPSVFLAAMREALQTVAPRQASG